VWRVVRAVRRGKSVVPAKGQQINGGRQGWSEPFGSAAARRDRADLGWRIVRRYVQRDQAVAAREAIRVGEDRLKTTTAMGPTPFRDREGSRTRPISVRIACALP
jgi:hypothetical protein